VPGLTVRNPPADFEVTSRCVLGVRTTRADAPPDLQLRHENGKTPCATSLGAKPAIPALVKN